MGDMIGRMRNLQLLKKEKSEKPRGETLIQPDTSSGRVVVPEIEIALFGKDTRTCFTVPCQLWPSIVASW